MHFSPPLPKFIEFILKVETPAVHFQVTLSRRQQATWYPTLRKAGALQTATLARAPQQHGKKLLRWCSFILQACQKMQSYPFKVGQKTFFPQSCKLNTSSLLKTKPRKAAEKTLPALAQNQWQHSAAAGSLLQEQPLRGFGGSAAEELPSPPQAAEVRQAACTEHCLA